MDRNSLPNVGTRLVSTDGTLVAALLSAGPGRCTESEERTWVHGTAGAETMAEKGSSPERKSMTENELKTYLSAQLDEIQRFKWCLGVELNRDPLEDRTFNSICEEWISAHSASFRKHWEQAVRNPRPN